MVLKLESKVLFLSMGVALVACGGRTEDHAVRARPVVWTAAWPMWTLTHRIAGELVDLRCALPADVDVEGFEPPRDTLLEIAKADLVVLNGAGLESWTDRAGLPTGRVIDASRELAADSVEFPHAVTHSHGPGGTHTHKGTNPHLWLDPSFAERQARAIHAGLLRVLPGQKDRLDAALGLLVDDLRAIDSELRALKFAEGDVVVASHPTWVYVARRYGWPMVDADFHADEVPEGAAIAAIKAACTGRRVVAVLFEEPPIAEVAAAVRGAVGAPCLAFDPDVNRTLATATRDTFTLEREGIAALRALLP